MAAAAACAAGTEPLTAEAVVRRMQMWPATAPDGFKAGDPATVVKGIATTAMATMDALRQAAKASANLVLTYEPTFYGRADASSGDDLVVKAKREFIEKNGLVVFRTRRENEMVTGLASALGWSKFQTNGDAALCQIPSASAENIVALIRDKLQLRAGLRVVGDRNAVVRRVLLAPGEMNPATMWQRYSDVDMIVAGEVREWENTHYAADMLTAGEKRALVTTGRVVSEEPGLRACAEWVKKLIREVPVKWIGVGDPYWRPA